MARGGRQRQLVGEQGEARRLVRFGACDVLAGQLAVGDGVEADDADRDLAVGDALDLERVHAAEIGDLPEASAVFSTSQTAVALGIKGNGIRNSSQRPQGPNARKGNTAWAHAGE